MLVTFVMLVGCRPLDIPALALKNMLKTLVASGITPNQNLPTPKFCYPQSFDWLPNQRQWTLALLSEPALIHLGLQITSLPEVGNTMLALTRLGIPPLSSWLLLI